MFIYFSAGIILGIAVTVAVAVVVFVIFNRKKRNKQPTNEGMFCKINSVYY